MRILTINPGSTSTKVAVFDGETVVGSATVRHERDEFAGLSVAEQAGPRLRCIADALAEAGVELSSLDAVAGRGGLVRPLPGGTYLVDEDLLRDLRTAAFGEHASNLGGILADALARPLGIPAYIVDPVVVDELGPLARYSGHPAIERVSIFHALNAKAVAKRYADEVGRPYDQLSLIVAHLGGGITVSAHDRGRVVDVNNGLDGDGPFAPERAGGLPTRQWVEYLLAERLDAAAAKHLSAGGGGVASLLGTSDMREAERRERAGDAEATLVRDALAYQVAKEIGAAAVVLAGQVDAILITGGLAYDPGIMSELTDRVDWIAPCVVHPGEDELHALMMGARRVLEGAEEVQRYADVA